jgi:hypothetical protein
MKAIANNDDNYLSRNGLESSRKYTPIFRFRNRYNSVTVFYAESFSAYQDIVVVVVILTGFIEVTGSIWASYEMNQQ